jgi:hypothetical protein
MGALRNLLDTLLTLFGIRLEPWVAPAVIIGGALVLSPLLFRNQSTGRARRILGRLATATTAAERAAIEAEAMALVEGNPDGLVVLAEAALDRSRTALARACLARLETLGNRPIDVRRLRRALDGDFPTTVDEVLVRLDAQRSAGLHVAAADTLERALRIWPDHPALKNGEGKPDLPPSSGV